MGTLPQYCIWDFNGTILDDVETGIAAVNHLLGERGLPLIESAERYREIFRFPIQGYYKRLGFDFEKEPYEVIAPLWVEQYLLRVPRARIYADVRETLERFRSLGIRQIILSATERGMLLGQIKSLGLEEYFEEVLGLDNIHAESKLALAKIFRERHPEEHAIFLGDTDHDLETAEQIGAECYLIAGGHQSEKYLRSLGVPVFKTLTDFYISRFGSES